MIKINNFSLKNSNISNPYMKEKKIHLQYLHWLISISVI